MQVTGTDALRDDTLKGKFLIAMPTMGDQRFERTVIYVCAHGEDGAMGLIINRPAPHITFDELLSQLGIHPEQGGKLPIHAGGPVETGRGFVLHTPDYFSTESTLHVSDGVDLTATTDILRAIANGSGPSRSLIALGYAGWGPGQLEAEIQANGWLVCDAESAIIFDDDMDTKWVRAMGILGVDPSLLSSEAGHA